MIGSYLPDNAQLSSTWQKDLITCLEKNEGSFLVTSLSVWGTFYAKGQWGPLIDGLFDDCLIDWLIDCRGTLTSEGAHWVLKRGGAHIFFPPNAVSEPTPIVVHRWKCSARSPPLLEHESVVSNVLEVSTITCDELEFTAEAKLVLSHSAPGLQGYELVIKRLIDCESNEWEEVDGTEDLRCWQGF